MARRWHCERKFAKVQIGVPTARVSINHMMDRGIESLGRLECAFNIFRIRDRPPGRGRDQYAKRMTADIQSSEEDCLRTLLMIAARGDLGRVQPSTTTRSDYTTMH